MPYFLALLAQVEMKAGLPDAALPPLEEAGARVQRTGEGWFAAEILRLKGEVLVTLGRREGRKDLLRARARYSGATEGLLLGATRGP